MTPAQKAQQTAYNEFIADYCDTIEPCQATRDEAHEVADWTVEMSKHIAEVCNLYADRPEVASDAANELAATMIDDNPEIDGKDEAKFLAACAIAAALEVVG